LNGEATTPLANLRREYGADRLSFKKRRISMDLRGAVGIVTGASSGIGWATAELLSEAGANLVVTARSGDKLTQLVADLTSKAVAVAGDIAEASMPQKLVDAACEQFGKLDFVFNNAGIMNIGSIDEVDDESMASMVRVNCEAAVRMAYTALRKFKSQGHGDLINTSSILGMKVRPTVGVYAGTKYAIEAMSESLRMELSGTGIRVMVIEPGYTATHLQSHWSDEQQEMLKAMETPLQPTDIARAVKFMLEQPPHVIVPRLLMVPVDQQI
jgi:NADP-dependent 3-hydroxy acid dehydrogenase YdfG